MGTNYYLHTNVCEHCNRSENRVHIGKSSAGWPFLFRGYRKWPPDGVPHPITSAAEWRAFIARALEQKAKIIDEYGREEPVTEFWCFVEDKKSETRGPTVSKYLHGERESEWTDAEGYRFCDNEFS